MIADYTVTAMNERENIPGFGGSGGAVPSAEGGDVRYREILEEQENRYRNLIQNIHEYIYSVNYADGIFSSTYHSDKSFEVTGYRPREYEENPYLWFSMIHEDDRRLVNEFLSRIQSAGGTATLEHRIIHKDGLVRWVSNTCSAVTGKDGRLAHLIGFVLDITKRKEAELRMHLAVSVLDRLNMSGDIREVIGEIITLVKKHLGIEAAGIRLMEGDDYPFFVTAGFPEYFVESENSLLMIDRHGNEVCGCTGSPALACLCGSVISGKTFPDSSHFTAWGSYWTNDSIDADIAAVLDRERIHMRPRCISEGYESMALIPLKSEHKTIGLLQMNDRRKGLFTRETIEFFEGIGASIGVALARKMAEEALQASEEKLRQRNETIERDLRLAHLVQGMFLTNRVVSDERMNVAYRYIPHDLIGGDYFSITPLHEGGIGIFIGDVVGHGITAALFMSLLKSATDRVCRTFGMKPGEYLRILNNELIEYMNYNFITAVYGFFDFNSGADRARFVFSNGGHPMPVRLVGMTKNTEFLDAGGTIIGGFPDITFEEKAVTLYRGDRLFFYTDGIPEAMDDEGRIIGFEEMQNVIVRSYHPDLERMLDRIIEHVHRHHGGRMIDDDILLIGFEIK